MIDAILFYLSWLIGVFLLAWFASGLFKIWWSLFALSHLEEYQYTMIASTSFEDLPTIKPLCDQHGISYTLIYFGRLCGRTLDKIRG